MAAAGVPLLAVTVLHAGTAVAVLTAAVYLPWLVIGLPTGAWVDRLPVVVFATAYQVFLSALVMAGELVEADAKLPQRVRRGAAGLAVGAVGATTLLFNAASFLASAACLLSIRANVVQHRPHGRATTVRAEISQGARFIARDPYLRPLSIYAATANLAYTGSTA